METLHYIPLNRHLLLEDVEEPEEVGKSKVLVPEEYKVVKKFGTYRVVESAPDCNTRFKNGGLVIVEEGMVREIEIHGDKKYYVLPENLVVLRAAYTRKTSSRRKQPAAFNED